jgi:hypothetical protein
MPQIRRLQPCHRHVITPSIVPWIAIVGAAARRGMASCSLGLPTPALVASPPFSTRSRRPGPWKNAVEKIFHAKMPISTFFPRGVVDKFFHAGRPTPPVENAVELTCNIAFHAEFHG